MTTPFENLRWVVNKDEFAQRIVVPDVQGGLSRQVIVEPGTRALLYDDGQCLGEVGAGTYVLESLVDKFRGFWRQKQGTVVLMRTDDFFVEVNLPHAWSADDKAVGLKLHCTFQVVKVAAFVANRMGPRAAVPMGEIVEDLKRLTGQVVSEILVTLTAAELRSPDARERVSRTLRRELDSVVARWGLTFTELHAFDMRITTSDDRREAGLADDKARLQLDVERARRERAGERADLDERTEAADQSRAERREQRDLDHEGSLERIRMRARNELREVLREEELAKVEHGETLEDAWQKRDVRKLLREEELGKYQEMLQRERGDRQKAADHIRRQMDLQDEEDIKALRLKREYELRLQRFDLEAELARRNEGEESRKLEHEIARDRRKTEEDHRRALADADQARSLGLRTRPEDLERLKHQLQLEELKRKADAERQREEQLLRRDRFRDQMERLRMLRENRHDDDRHEEDLEDRRTRREREGKRDDRDHELSLAEMDMRRRQVDADALARLSAEAAAGYAAMSGNNAGAQILADIRKSSHAAEAGKAQAEASHPVPPSPSVEVQKLAENYTERLFALLDKSMNRDSGANAAPPTPPQGPVVIVPGQTAGIRVCIKCGQSNPLANRCCAHCGQVLG